MNTESTDLLTRLTAEYERGAVMYRSHGDNSRGSFIFADHVYDEVTQGNALIVPKSAITPAIEEWIANYAEVEA